MPPGCLRHPRVCKICFFFLFCNRWHPANLSGAVGSLMAVINSVGVGRGSKSVGEFTYRYTRGRTIASRRITRNTSKTPAQVGRRGAFGSFVWMFSPYKWFFSDGYEKTKHGSSFNQFVHVNRELLGKSPYNSEVNKKLIPNGARLHSLLEAILNTSVPHLKYATYGSLNAAIISSSMSNNFYAVTNFKVHVFVDDFKSISLVLLGVDSMGNTYSKEIPLYSDSDIPSFSYNSQYTDVTDKTSVVSYPNQGYIAFEFQYRSFAELLTSISQELTSPLRGFANVIISQNGKIASIPYFFVFSLIPKET